MSVSDEEGNDYNFNRHKIDEYGNKYSVYSNEDGDEMAVYNGKQRYNKNFIKENEK